MALTATADAPTRGDIVDKLFVRHRRALFVRSFDRPNLRLAMQAQGALVAPGRWPSCASHPGDSGIVYCASRRKVEELAETLASDGIDALPYHAGLDKRVRDANQDAFQQQDGVVMTATVAFGMGIDKPDVRFVCHADLPANVEAYYQEIGRAGRDGLPADTLTLYGLGDMQLRRAADRAERDAGRAQARRAPAAQRAAGAGRGAALPPPDAARLFRRELRALRQLRSLPRRRRALRRHDRGAEGDVGDRAHRRALRHGAPGRHPDRRAAPRTCCKYNHDRLPTFGVGKDRARREWRSIFRQLSATGLIQQDLLEHGRWSVTEAGWRVLKGGQRIELRKELARRPRLAARKAGGGRVGRRGRGRHDPADSAEGAAGEAGADADACRPMSFSPTGP